MAVSLAALVVALGGTATAGTLITGRNVKDGSLTGRDIHDGSIQSRDLTPSLRKLFSTGTAKKEPPLVVLSGPPGPQGPTGPAGPAAGGLSPSKVHLRQSETKVVQGGPAGDVQTAVAFCDPGEVPTGGGYYSNIAHAGISGPHVDPSSRQLVGWSVSVDGLGLPDGTSQEIRAFAVCVATQ
jgi:hypothetical protein